MAAIDRIPSPQPGDVVYAITDGVDTNSHSDRGVVENRLLQTGVRFFAFAPDPYRLQAEPDHLDPIALLRLLAQATGGDLFPQKTKPDRRVAEANRFYKQMLSVYEIEIELAFQPDKAREWSLQLADDNQRKGSHIFYPRKLLPCSARR